MTSSVRFVYQVVVPKSVAPKELLQVYEAGEMTVLPAWDPMVCLSNAFSLGGLVLNPCWYLGSFGMTVYLECNYALSAKSVMRNGGLY